MNVIIIVVGIFAFSFIRSFVPSSSAVKWRSSTPWWICVSVSGCACACLPRRLYDDNITVDIGLAFCSKKEKKTNISIPSTGFYFFCVFFARHFLSRVFEHS